MTDLSVIKIYFLLLLKRQNRRVFIFQWLAKFFSVALFFSLQLILFIRFAFFHVMRTSLFLFRSCHDNISDFIFVTIHLIRDDFYTKICIYVETFSKIFSSGFLLQCDSSQIFLLRKHISMSSIDRTSCIKVRAGGGVEIDSSLLSR